jgi:predicted nucleic acid-binding protein
MKKFRTYVDTSVFGGVFDDEFSKVSKKFFEQVKADLFSLVISPVIQNEIASAPQQVQEFFDEILPSAELIKINDDAIRLRQAYLDAKILTPKSSDDALHVALATTSGCALIVSWNFKHIVHFEKIPMYNGVNAVNGFPNVAIFSPLEVIKYEDKKI